MTKSGTKPAIPLPPYVPWKTFITFLEGLKQGVPSRIDRTVMATFSGAYQSQIIAALKYLSLIDESGRPQDALTQLVTSEGKQRNDVLSDIIHDAYGKYDTFADLDLDSATSGQLEEAFKRAGATGDTVRKCIAFFLAANQYAGLTLSPHFKSPRTRQNGGRRRGRTVRRRVPVLNEPDPEPEDSTRDYLTWEQMLLAKFPAFDPAWPDDVKAEWFKAFNRLMNREGSGIRE